MRKIVLGLLIMIITILGGVYFFIPGSLRVSSVIVVNCTINGTNRYLLDQDKWHSWWPGDGASKDFSFQTNGIAIYRGCSYKATRPLYNGLEVLIEKDGLKISSVINNFSLSTDSVAVQWQYALKTSLNPVTRWRQYLQAKAVKNNIETLLVHLQSFLRKRENVYGIDIQEIFSRDTTLIFTKDTSDNYPEVGEIYSLIEKLKQHISTQHSIATNYPMLHVRKIDSRKFEIMVAISVNKPLKETGRIINKRFVPWKTLVGETKGGVYTINQAYEKMEVFIKDYQKMPMAIPFELLVTDRRLEPDTLKWISIICQPVS